MSATRDVPHLSVVAPVGPARGIVVVLHGGQQRSFRPVRRTSLPALRMRPFVRSIHRRTPDVAIAVVRYRRRGWNDADPLEDVAYVVDAMEARCGTGPVVLVGHSMGGRAALRSAGLPRVAAVAALAPWIPEGEPIEQLAGRDVLLVHGLRDHTTSPEATARFTTRIAPIARAVVSLQLPGAGHAMLRRAAVWHRLTAEFVAAISSASPIANIGDGERGVVRVGPDRKP